jgi:hypothetical protein
MLHVSTESMSAAARIPNVGKAEVRMWRDPKTQRAYTRELPGGGFVAIDVTRVTSLLHRHHFHGTLSVERRASWRREGHAAPVIGEASGPSVESVLRQLLPAAQFNPAIGSALLHR